MRSRSQIQKKTLCNIYLQDGLKSVFKMLFSFVFYYDLCSLCVCFQISPGSGTYHTARLLTDMATSGFPLEHTLTLSLTLKLPYCFHVLVVSNIICSILYCTVDLCFKPINKIYYHCSVVMLFLHCN